MMKIYASENRMRAIKVNEDREIVAAYGLKNVLCCEADGENGIIAMEELVEIDPATEFDWSEIAQVKTWIDGGQKVDRWID